jgi:hypothetical protein
MPSLPPIRPEDEQVALKQRPHGAFDAPVDEAHGRTLFELALRLGDDSLILGQRLANGAATRRRSRSTSASPTSRST